MKYQFKSFSIPPAVLPKGVNTHGQSWEDIFGVARGEESIPSSEGVARVVGAGSLIEGKASPLLGQLPKETD